MTLVANLTVGIATLDRPSGLTRCVDALLSGDVLPAEIIIVDQSANAATRAVVEKRKGNESSIIYVHQERCGLSASRNAVIARASYPIIVVTDDDCVPDGGWVRAIQRAFTSSNSAADAVTGRVLPLGPETHGLYEVSSRHGRKRCEFSGKTMPWIVGTGANFAVKKEWFHRIGNFDERLGVGSPGRAGEDADVIYRLLCAGAHVVYEPDAVIYHERQTKARRLATRWSYGHGIGAFCGIWLRRGDSYSLRVLGRWVYWQCRDLAIASVRWQWLEAYQRWLSLMGTLGGLMYGLCCKSLPIPYRGAQ